MTDLSDTASERKAPLTEWETKAAVHSKLEAELLDINKPALLNALALIGITEVIVTFDGYADSGQIENVAVRVGDDDSTLPATTIEIGEAVWGESEPRRSSVSIASAVESLAYDVLEQTPHSGWENNDGAYGDIVFDVAERTITLDYNERYSGSNHSHDIF